ncbi:MAG: RNA polymerase sigma factor [Phyllobacterium sp.]
MPTQLRLKAVSFETCSETELVALARNGEEGAVRLLIQRNNRRLFKMARALLKNDAEAEDVVQETYVRAFTKLAMFRGDSSFSTWLTRIALNDALGRLRKRPVAMLELDDIENQNNGAELLMFPTSPVQENPECGTDRAQVRRLLESIIDDLPEPFRLVVVLRDIEDLSTEETADFLQIKKQTVKTRLHRARQLMRAALDEKMSSAFDDIFPFGGARCNALAERVLQRLRSSGQF